MKGALLRLVTQWERMSLTGYSKANSGKPN